MVVTNSADLADKVREYGNFCYGKEQKFYARGHRVQLPSEQYQCPVGVGQLQRIDSILARKQYIYQRYMRNLEGTQGLCLPKIRPWAKSVMWMFNAHVEAPYRLTGMTQAGLERKGHRDPGGIRAAQSAKDFPGKRLGTGRRLSVANYIMDHGLYLPSGLNLTDDDIDYVSEMVRQLGSNLTLKRNETKCRWEFMRTLGVSMTYFIGTRTMRRKRNSFMNLSENMRRIRSSTGIRGWHRRPCAMSGGTWAGSCIELSPQMLASPQPAAGLACRSLPEAGIFFGRCP